MVEHDWTPSTITPGHLQKLMKHGFMAVVEFEVCHVPEDRASRTCGGIGGVLCGIL
jgi:hypothetical protein